MFDQFKILADQKKEIFDGDIAALIEREIFGSTNLEWTLQDYGLQSQSGKEQSIHVRLRRGEEIVGGEDSSHRGPIHAAFKVIRSLVDLDVECANYQAQSMSIGGDATVDVNVELRWRGQIYRGRGVSPNLVEASLVAIINSVNRALLYENAVTNGAARSRSTI